MNLNRIIRAYQKYLSRRGCDVEDRMINRYRTCAAFKAQMIHETFRMRGIRMARKFLTLYTKKYKLKVLVMQFFYRLGAVQTRFKSNKDYTRQKSEILAIMFEKYHQT